MLSNAVCGKTENRFSTRLARGFTLIELLVVVGIVAVLSTVVVLALNPAELLRQSRDNARLSDLKTINSALNLYQLEFSSGFGDVSTVYVSLPDSAATPPLRTNCSSFNLPPLTPPYVYACAAPSTYRNVDGNGWMPVNFSQLSISSPLSVLPIDPINRSENGLYYTYISGGSWELTAKMESAVYQAGANKDVVGKDSGDSSLRYEIGNDLFLTPNIGDGSATSTATSTDTTAPARSAGAPSGTFAAGTTATTLSLTTDEPATCKYGTVAGTVYASLPSTFTTTGGTSHSTNVSGLTNGTAYNYYVRCQDAALNANTADFTISFNVANAADTTAPTVSITSPAPGTTVSSTVTVTASASDNVAVAGVQFKLDGANLGAEDTAPPYSMPWMTTLEANGAHTLTAVARDTSANTATSSAVGVTVGNPVPDTTPPSVPAGLSATAISSSQINLSWTASTDAVGVTGYQVFRGGVQIVTSTLTSYSNTGLVASTTYMYAVAAFDAAGNISAQSASANATTNPGASTKFTIGNRAQVSSGPLNVRSTASVSGTLLGTQATGALGTVAGGSTYADGFQWWQITYDIAPSGWSVEDFLVIDTTPPVRSNGAPSGTFAAGTTATTLSLTTDEPATCKYGTTASTIYASMTNTFTTTGTTSHSTNVSGLTDGATYNYYVRCQDVALNANTTDFLITFNVASAAVSAPTVTSVTPASSTQGTTGLTVTVNGTNFASGASVSMSGTGITVNSTTFVSATQLTANITIAAGAAIGVRDVAVTNTDTGTGSGIGLFTVRSWWNASWQNRRKITFNNSAATQNLINFPALVSLSSSNIDYAKTQNAGQDIRFVDADDQTALNYEIERWDEAGTSVVWVRVPQIDAASASDFVWMYYNNPAAADSQNITGTWDANYRGVWHLPNGTTLTANDSTSGANNGAAAAVAAAAGQVDGAGSFDGATSVITAGTSDTLLTENGAITISAWVNPITTGEGGFGRIVDRSAANTGPLLLLTTVTGSTRLRFGVTGSTNMIAVSGAGVTVTLGAWNYITMTWDGSATAANVVFYVNAAATGANSTNTNGAAPADNNAATFRIGNDASNGRTFNGTIDEVRVSNVIRSSSWIGAEYRNGINTFNGFGSEEQR